MGIKDFRPRDDKDNSVEGRDNEYAFSSIEKWAEELEIPAASLLHHASAGALKAFFIPCPSEVALRYVNTSQLDLTSFELEIPPALASKELLKYLYTEQSLFGIQLEPAQCAALALGQSIRATFFDHVMVRGSPWMAHFDSSADAWDREMPSGTRIASFSTVYPAFLDSDQSSRSVSGHLLSSKWNRTPEEYARTPVAHLVRPSDVLVRDVDLKAFIRSLTSYDFISDLYQDKQLLDEMPSYVSEKLEEIVLVNRVFWKGASALTRAEIDARDKRAVTHLGGDFRDMCPRTSSPDGLVAFASQAANPTIRHSEDHPSVTPALLALLTASKLYWSPTHVDLSRNETLPEPACVTRFLRFMGLTDGNEAASGTVVIRPNNAINYTPKHRQSSRVEPLLAEIGSRRRAAIEAVQKWQATADTDDSPSS